jgi:Ran GTPase-activating protein (RanGAP) involved in mRNA processing and transport
LRGNRSLQKLSLKGNPIKEGVAEIAKSFVQNKKSLTIKELDLSKCQLECEHLTQDFFDMIRAPYTTLKVLSLRDNLIRCKGSEQLKDALKFNKTITKIFLDYNPIKP